MTRNSTPHRSSRRQHLQRRGGLAYDKSEGKVAKTIEEQTAKLPSDTFLWMALGAMGTSARRLRAGRETAANLLLGGGGRAFLFFGVCDKLVKQRGPTAQPGTAAGGLRRTPSGRLAPPLGVPTNWAGGVRRAALAAS